jgi:hypothetical protein
VAIGVVAVSTAALAGPAAAAKGGANSSSLELVVLSAARTVDSSVAVARGDEVTFDVSTAADRPFVGLRCWQDDNFVYDAYVGYFPDYRDATPSFTLDSGFWLAGSDATCTARLIQWSRQGRENVLATTSFAVAG